MTFGIRMKQILTTLAGIVMAVVVIPLFVVVVLLMMLTAGLVAIVGFALILTLGVPLIVLSMLYSLGHMLLRSEPVSTNPIRRK